MPLNLGRRCNQSISLFIDDKALDNLTESEMREILKEGLSFTVYEIRRNQVKITFDTPDEWTILRSELLKKHP